MAVQAANDLDSALKETQTLHAVLLLTIPLFIYAGEVLGPAKTKDVKKIGLFLVVLAILNAWSVLSTYPRRVREAREALRSRPDDTRAVIRWRAASIASLAACEPLALYGVALRVWGGTFLEAAPFYACALIMLLAFTPQRPSGHAPAHPTA